MSKEFREWKQLIKRWHVSGKYREYKPTMYYYKKMTRKVQRAHKRAEKSWRRFEQELLKEWDTDIISI